ncbi:hypothetical protein [Sphingomonas sp. Mn802worker]|uniref:hypothetical protein n=1 Tax=Sphingomonas sp. Mn802worker TaxID=629773 RepID=UPI0012E9C3EC|nr:hypothetical protein [Sphingomonas sp. Mn802worker]
MTLFVLRVQRHVETVRVEHLSRRIRLALHASVVGQARTVRLRPSRERPAL